jgi:hypothetical protein
MDGVGSLKILEDLGTEKTGGSENGEESGGAGEQGGRGI